jgi:hypothetical protein
MRIILQRRSMMIRLRYQELDRCDFFGKKDSRSELGNIRYYSNEYQ